MADKNRNERPGPGCWIKSKPVTDDSFLLMLAGPEGIARTWPRRTDHEVLADEKLISKMSWPDLAVVVGALTGCKTEKKEGDKTTLLRLREQVGGRPQERDRVEIRRQQEIYRLRLFRDEVQIDWHLAGRSVFVDCEEPAVILAGLTGLAARKITMYEAPETGIYRLTE